MTGLDYTATVRVDEEGIRDLDELEYDYTRIEADSFGFITTAVFTVSPQQVMENVDVEVTAGGVE